jgi:hypothetical protein
VYLTALLAGDRRPLAEILEEPLRNGWVHLHAPYEEVHKLNLEAVA